MVILEMLFGKHGLQTWVVCSIFAVVGFILFKCISYKKRDEKETPFDLRYWWEDNKIEFFIGLILFWFLTRFYEETSEFLSSTLGIPKIENLFIFNFMVGFLFQVILKKLRKHFRLSEDASGEPRDVDGTETR